MNSDVRMMNIEDQQDLKEDASAFSLPPSAFSYTMDRFGVIHQLPPIVPPVYDADYVAKYDRLGVKGRAMSCLRLGHLLSTVPLRDPNGLRLLDVGYGNGDFLKVAAAAGFQARGCDVSGVAVGDPRVRTGADLPLRPERGIYSAGTTPTIGTSLRNKFRAPEDGRWEMEDREAPDPPHLPSSIFHLPAAIAHYHIITFYDSLEHFPSLDFLGTLAADYLVISLPWCHWNERGWWQPEFRTWKHFKPGEHLHYFNDVSLKKLLKHHGFLCLHAGNVEDGIRGSLEEPINQNIRRAELCEKVSIYGNVAAGVVRDDQTYVLPNILTAVFVRVREL